MGWYGVFWKSYLRFSVAGRGFIFYLSVVLEMPVVFLYNKI